MGKTKKKTDQTKKVLRIPTIKLITTNRLAHPYAIMAKGWPMTVIFINIKVTSTEPTNRTNLSFSYPFYWFFVFFFGDPNKL